MQVFLPLAFGVLIGFSLGLTGGGGSILAMPLLVYGLGLPPHQAVGISLGAVGVTAAIGVFQRLRKREVEIRIGLIFAAAGMLGAPVGTRLGQDIPAPVLLVLFALLMVLVAARMWFKASKNPEETRVVRAGGETRATAKGPACRHDPGGTLKMTARCTAIMTMVGFITGILSGLFGVGGGFVIVPALIFFTAITIHQAVATSLMVIVLISFSGAASFFLSGRDLHLDIASLFVLGGISGMGAGTLLSQKISGPLLQKLFAFSILLLAVFMLAKDLL